MVIWGMVFGAVLPVFSSYLALRLPHDPRLGHAKWVLVGQGLFVFVCIEIAGFAQYRAARRHSELA